MKLRSYFRQTLTNMHRLHRESGEERPEPIPLYQYCDGDGDVVGVVTPLVRGIAQVWHGDQVVELSVQLEVQEVEGKDREELVEVERERRVKEVRPWI